MDVDLIVRTVADVVEFIQEHPVLSGLVLSAIAATESLPFVKKIEASGLVQLLVNIVKVVTKKKGA